MRVLPFLLLACTSASAQVLPPPPAAGAVGASQPTGRDAYALAVDQLARGQTAEATALLEDLRAGAPGDLSVALKLQEAYEAGGRTDDALRLVEARAPGASVYARVERGAVYVRAERLAEAQAEFDAAIALDPSSDQPYRAAAEALAQARRYPEAAVMLERGRTALGDSDLFVFELAAVYGAAFDYDRAADLYLSVLATRPDALAPIRSQIRRLLGGTGAPEAFQLATERAQTRDPLNRAFREMASFLALERGDYDAALDGIRALDRLDREEGQSLLAFARTAQAAGALDATARALDEILTRHPDGPVASDALIARARLGDERARDASERVRGATPQADAARTDYQAFLDRFPNATEASRARLDLAHLTRDVFLDFEMSQALLTEATEARDASVANEARLDLGDVAVRRGDLDAARERFQTVDETMQTGTLAEQARFELALLDFYEGFVFSALARVEAIDENVAADATNDAIALRVTLNENADEDSDPANDPAVSNTPLKSYAAASLLVRQGHDTEALTLLDSLGGALGAQHPLFDEILFLSAQAQRRLGEPARALTTLDRLASDVPLSFFRDRALVLQAEIAERDLSDPAGASDRLRQLLDQFSGSLFAPEAREKLRALRASS